MKYDMDKLLRNALSSQEEPEDCLNQRIIKKVQEKESENMSKKNRRIGIPAVAMLAAAILVAGSASVYAAWRYLSPQQVAQTNEDKKLAAAFDSEDAVMLGEVQEYGNYRITLLGIVSGKNLSEYIAEDEKGNVLDDRTYVVTAIENKDGTPRPDTSADNYGEDPFFVSPLIQGLNPAIFNSVTMSGGYFETVENGVQYRVAECDNVEKFADRQVYLCVSDGNFYNNNAYTYDEQTGSISRNEQYQGVNALFTLPLDASKADKAAAEAYVKELEDEWNGGSEGEEVKAGESEENITSRVAKEVENWTYEDFEQNAELIKELELPPNEEGEFEYKYEIGEEGLASKGTLGEAALSERDEGNMSKFRTIMDGENPQTAYIETYTLKEDGNVILRVYKYSE